jgi:nitrogen-specific signal transduction histidine kinase/CheY-like chemotaxis protein
VELSSNPITFQEREAVLVLANDVTEKVKLEAQLLQSQKMEAIGQLAGGVAHDFNNLLGVITGYAELLLKDLGALHPGLHRVEQIQRAAERAGGLTRQLLAFSRKQVLLPEVLELNSVLDETEKMLRRLIGEDVQLVTVFAPGLGLVKADPGQMEQVIVNLAVNARDAMPGGGKLIIETSNVDLDANYTRTHPEVRPGPYVMLAVSDTGHGMNTDTMSRIFEPFFTTKEVGKGTGLGLSTVFGIVKQSGGHIGVYSEVGRGTSFKVYLPRIERSGEVAPAGVARAEALPVGSETILLVEDEEALRQLIREILEVGGYRVLPGGSPEEALAAAEAHSGPIHLLLTDVVMPLMSGRQVADRIKASRPAVRVMYMSGYTDEAISHHGALEPGTEFLQKPFTAHALLRKVREVLEA